MREGAVCVGCWFRWRFDVWMVDECRVRGPLIADGTAVFIVHLVNLKLRFENVKAEAIAEMLG